MGYWARKLYPSRALGNLAAGRITPATDGPAADFLVAGCVGPVVELSPAVNAGLLLCKLQYSNGTFAANWQGRYDRLEHGRRRGCFPTAITNLGGPREAGIVGCFGGVSPRPGFSAKFDPTAGTAPAPLEASLLSCGPADVNVWGLTGRLPTYGAELVGFLHREKQSVLHVLLETDMALGGAHEYVFDGNARGVAVVPVGGTEARPLSLLGANVETSGLKRVPTTHVWFAICDAVSGGLPWATLLEVAGDLPVVECQIWTVRRAGAPPRKPTWQRFMAAGFVRVRRPTGGATQTHAMVISLSVPPDASKIDVDQVWVYNFGQSRARPHSSVAHDLAWSPGDNTVDVVGYLTEKATGVAVDAYAMKIDPNSGQVGGRWWRYAHPGAQNVFAAVTDGSDAKGDFTVAGWSDGPVAAQARPLKGWVMKLLPDGTGGDENGQLQCVWQDAWDVHMVPADPRSNPDERTPVAVKLIAEHWGPMPAGALRNDPICQY